MYWSKKTNLCIQHISSVKILGWFLGILAAVIMLASLFYKFSVANESVIIFSKIGMEPWGKYVIEIAEFISSLLLFFPAYIWLGALMGLTIMGTAIVFHLTILGVKVKGDKGCLFYLACTICIGCLIICSNHEKNTPFIN